MKNFIAVLGLCAFGAAILYFCTIQKPIPAKVVDDSYAVVTTKDQTILLNNHTGETWVWVDLAVNHEDRVDEAVDDLIKENGGHIQAGNPLKVAGIWYPIYKANSQADGENSLGIVQH